MTLRRALALAALIGVVPTADAVAAAAPKHPRIETFKVTVRGSQVTTWSMRGTDDPDDPCDSPANGDGSQMIRFFGKPQRVRVMRVGGEVTFLSSLKAPVTVEREGEVSSGPSDLSQCDPVAIGDNDDLAPLVGPDCGTRRGSIDLRLALGSDEADGDELLAPLIGRDALVLWGEFDRAITYEDCPWWIGGPVSGPSDTGISTTARRLRVKDVFNRRRKVLKASADLTQKYTNPGFTGKTLLTWNVRLERVR